jgi:adenosylcobinamide hydrolase
MIYRLSTGDEVHRYEKSIVIPFEGERKVLSTSPINGAYREDLKFVFNHDGNPGAGIECKLKAPTYEEHMYLIAEELGLEPEKTAGISTAASMENVSIKEENYRDLTVTAIVTGGIEVNGGRIGDPSYYYEEDGKYENIKEGTINIILVIDADLTPGAITRALVSCTEGKTAAIQELVEGSHYSRGLATGSGTDGTIIVSNSESPLRLTGAGNHSKLGELIGVVVKEAVKEALFLQTGLCPKKQHSVLRRTKRFGVNEDTIWHKYKDIVGEVSIMKPQFIHNLHTIDTMDELVTLTSLYVHLLDQLDWGLLSAEEVVEEGEMILKRIGEAFDIDMEEQEKLDDIHDMSTDGVVEAMMDKFIEIIAVISVF